MLTLPSTLLAASESPHGGAWVLMWDIELQRRTKTLPPVVFRMTSRHEEVTWPPSTGETFYPFGFSMTPLEQDNEGNLPGIDLAIDNTGRVLMRHAHGGEGFEGNRATLYITHANALDVVDESIDYEFQVQSATAAQDSIALKLEATNLNEKRIPWGRYIQGACRWSFGGPECSYPITPTAAYTSCAKTIAACSERGDDEVSRNLPRLHPRRFGGFPGIATQRSGN